MGISENIKKLRTSNHMTQEEFGDVAGVSAMAVSQWENGRAVPRMGAVERIAEYFKVSKGTVIDERTHNYSMPPGAIPIKPSGKAFLPYRGRIHAGDPIEADGVEEVEEVPECVASNHPNGFLLDVVGDCMNNVYPEGSRIVVDPTLEPQTGDIGAFMLNGEVVMRRVHRGASFIMLSPDSTNEEYTDIVVSGDDELISYGRVVWYQSKEEM